MFQFPAFASGTRRMTRSHAPGCPIRTSAALRVFAPPRSFSQLITSFFASESQGIPHTPFLHFVVSSKAKKDLFLIWFRLCLLCPRPGRLRCRPMGTEALCSCFTRCVYSGRLANPPLMRCGLRRPSLPVCQCPLLVVGCKGFIPCGPVCVRSPWQS